MFLSAIGIIYCIFFGFANLIRFKNNISFHSFLLLNVYSSLFISWYFFLIIFYFSFQYQFLIYVAIIGALLPIWFQREKISIDIHNILGFVFLAAIAFGLAYASIKAKYYSSIFDFSDALVTWNRWAIEFFSGRYGSGSSAYTFFWPSVWSLVYVAQGTPDIWIVAKATTFAFPVFVGLTAMVLLGSRLYFSAIFYTIFVFGHYFYLSVGSTTWAPNIPLYALTVGFMDAPVAVLIVLAGTLLIAAKVESNAGNSSSAYLTAIGGALVAGIAGITKQSGLLICVLYLAAVPFLLNPLFSLRRYILLIFLIVSPFVGYAIMHKMHGGTFAGNLAYLSALTARVRGDANTYVYAWNLLALHIGTIPLVAMVAIGAANVLFFKNPVQLLGAVFLICAGFSFVSFAGCCAYHERNGWGAVSFMVLSDIAFLAKWVVARDLFRPFLVSRRSISIAIAGIFVVLAGAGAAYFPDEKLLQLQQEKQFKIAGGDISKITEDIFYKNETIPIVTAIQVAAWVPRLRERTRICPANNNDCLKRVVSENKKVFLLTNEKSADLRFDLSEFGDRAKKLFEQNQIAVYEITR